MAELGKQEVLEGSHHPQMKQLFCCKSRSSSQHLRQHWQTMRRILLEVVNNCFWSINVGQRT